MMTVFVFHQKVVAARKAKVPKPAAIEKNPLVSFRYPKSNASWQLPLRTVRLISANGKYFWGLEITHNPETGKLVHKPKRFLRVKATEFHFLEFNTEAMP
jgi:hypothetical protein